MNQLRDYGEIQKYLDRLRDQLWDALDHFDYLETWGVEGGDVEESFWRLILHIEAGKDKVNV